MLLACEELGLNLSERLLFELLESDLSESRRLLELWIGAGGGDLAGGARGLLPLLLCGRSWSGPLSLLGLSIPAGFASQDLLGPVDGKGAFGVVRRCPASR